MKVYSDDVVTIDDMKEAAQAAAKSVADQVAFKVNAKQDRQIMQLRIALAAVFIVNLLVAIFA